MDELEKYTYLWRDPGREWGLLYVNKEEPNEAPRYLVVNLKDRSALLIHDEDLASRVKERMLSAGAPIVVVGGF